MSLHRALAGSLVVAALLASAFAAPAAAERDPEPAAPAAPTTAPAPATVPPRQDVLILPLHAHVLTAAGRPDIDCKLTDDDLARILDKVNKVWRPAGVQFHVRAVHREPAENLAEFDAQAKVAPGGLGHYRLLAPAKTADAPGIHVYYVHELPPNGMYLGDNVCFVKETASLRKVEGGIDEPIPRVTAHEIGHALGLRHRQLPRTNLMASGMNGTTLNPAEVRIARDVAAANPGVLDVPAAEAEIAALERRGEAEQAASLKRLLRSLR